MAKPSSYDVQRVNRTNFIVILSIVALLIIESYISGGIDDALDTAIKGAVVVVIVVITFFLPINKYIKGLFLCLIPAIVTLALFYLTGFTIDKHYIILASTAMVALYFKKEVLISYGIIMDILIIMVYALRPTNFISESATATDFLATFILFNTSVFLLYLLSRWGGKMVEEAIRNENEVRSLFDRLENTFSRINTSAIQLDTNMDKFNTGIETTRDSSNFITTSIEEIAKGISEEASNISSVNAIMVNSTTVVMQAQEISREVAHQANEMSMKVEDGISKIEKVSNQVTVTNDAIVSASETVLGLQKSMETINGLLEGIRLIAGQTNLLALNAAIESARAGEQGKGFAVVADEVRKLAEQSASMVNNINTVVIEISEKSRDAFAMVNRGVDATNESKGLINEIASYFLTMKDTFDETNSRISQAMEMTGTVTEKFTDSQRQIEAVAGISQEIAASIEEIQAAIESENKQIIDISRSTEEVKLLSKELKELAEL